MAASSGGAQGKTPDGPRPDGQAEWNDEHRDFTFGRRLRNAFATQPYVREHGDPLFRTLSIYTSDPAASRRKGAIEEAKFAYEPLSPGPIGSVVEVDNRDGSNIAYPRADLDQTSVLLGNGYRPSLSCPEFHAQMVYAVAMLIYHSFHLALGRPVAWPFRPDEPAPRKLRLRPYGAKAKNAWYDAKKGELVFGYFEPLAATPAAPLGKGSRVYTSLSHDIVVHEMSHALLDGMRARFLQPTHPDVLALHEAFADLMAFFQQFQFDDPVRAALTRSRGVLLSADDLVTIAREFGTGAGLETGTLRTLVDREEHEKSGKPLHLDDVGDEPHARGAVLTRTIVSAFAEIYKRRTRRYIRLATGGRDELRDGELTEPLLDLLVSDVKKLAVQIQSICIRAIDYCPPVDVRFGDYLRALVTADMELVPDDDLGYRETLIRAFGKRGIYGEGALHMTEDALRWRPPKQPLQVPLDKTGAIAVLATGIGAESIEKMREQLALAVGELLVDPENGHAFGIISPRDPEFDPASMSRPIIDSISIARRIGHDQQMTFDVVAEITQRRTATNGKTHFDFYGGSTIIMDCKGAIRFAVRKRINKGERIEEQAAYMKKAGARFWKAEGDQMKLSGDVAHRLCAF